MALYTYSEFRELCGVSDAYISVNASRGKIVYSDGKKVDTKIQVNADFLRKMLQKKQLNQKNQIIKTVPEKKTKQVQEKKTEIKPKKENVAPAPIDVGSSTEINYSSTIRNEDGSLPNNDALLAIEKKKLEIEQKEIQIRISLLNEAKLRGENIPMDEVKSMIRELSTSFITNYKDSFEKMIIEICYKNKIKSDEEGRIKNEFINVLNTVHRRVFEDVKNNLSQIKRKSIDNVQLGAGN